MSRLHLRLDWDQPVAVGLAVFDSAHAGAPLLAFVATVPDWQRQGLARALITRAISALHVLGWRQLHLAVHGENPARRLYEQLGWVLVS